MAVTWNWDSKCGEMVIHQHYNDKDYTINLYQGNCLLVFINEWKEDGKDKYSFWSFFDDKDHMNVCLGLKKRYDGTRENIFGSTGTIKKLRLNKTKFNKKDFVNIVSAFAQAFDNIEIEIYKEEEDDSNDK